jgi:hypothetical protein
MGISAKRRKNENDRAGLNSDTYQAIIEVLNATRRGDLSLSEAMSRWSTIKSNYFSRIAGYDSKTKRIATDVWNREFEPTYLPLIQQAAKEAEEAKKRESQLEPEFNIGGHVGRRFADGGTYHPQLVSQLMPMRPNGLTPGVYSRADQYVARFTGNEVILNPDQWMPLTPALTALKVPGFADGGAQPEVSIPSFASSSSDSKDGDIVINVAFEFDGENLVLKVLDSPKGRKVVLNTMGSYEGRKITKNNNIANRGKGSSF